MGILDHGRLIAMIVIDLWSRILTFYALWDWMAISPVATLLACCVTDT